MLLIASQSQLLSISLCVGWFGTLPRDAVVRLIVTPPGGVVKATWGNHHLISILHLQTLDVFFLFFIMGRMGICFTSVATSWWGKACCLLQMYYASRLGVAYCVALSAVLNFDYLGECSHWGNRGRVAQPASDENLCYITPGTSLVNEAPPMPLHHTRGAPIPPVVLPLQGTVVGRDYLPEASPGSEPW